MDRPDAGPDAGPDSDTDTDTDTIPPPTHRGAP